MNMLTRWLRGGETPSKAPAPAKPTMRYLRPDRAGILGMRRAITRDAKIDVWEAADRAAALALDFMHNSGWIAGAANQVICDTIGVELKLNARPDLGRLGYNAADQASWAREVEAEWRRWAWNPKECDLAGKATVAEILDGSMRHYLCYGEAFGVLDYMTVRQRRSYGLETGTKLSLISPHRLPRHTREYEGLDQGIFHDAIGRATHYRFKRREGGMDVDADIRARDVIHVMDRGENPGSPRGISPMAPMLKVIAQSDQLADATLATALLQTIFAATITSPEPSAEAFQAIQSLEDMPAPEGYDEVEWADMVGAVQGDLVEVWGQRMDALKSGGINLADSGRIAHQGPGEKLEFHTAATPGSQYLPYSKNLQREAARCLGVTFESFTGDHSGATYTSERMGVASVWPITTRRRQRIPAPMAQGVYEAWLEEGIGEGRIKIKGGYEAFLANKERVFASEWQGPAQPSADDYKSALAAKIRLELGITCVADETAMLGKDWEENVVQIAREIEALKAAGIPHPFGRATGGAGPNGAAADGRREQSRAEARMLDEIHDELLRDPVRTA